MSIANFEIEEYQEAFKEDCIRLLECTFPGSSNRCTFDWRFSSVRKHKPIIVCARDGNKIVSFNSWLPWEFVHKEKVYLGYQSGESATDVNYRRKGIFEKVLNKADNLFKHQSIDFVFGFPSAMSIGAFYKAGYCPVGLYNYHIRLMNPFALPYKAMPKATANFDNLGIIEKQKITPIANDEYAQWRYVKNPHHYEFINYRENNNTALFIVRINRYFNKNYHFQIKELLLIDCQLSSFNDLFIEHAMNHLSRLYAHKARYIRTFFNPMTDRGMVLNNFFHRKMKKRYETLIIKPISDSLPLEIFLNFDNWDILPHVKDSF